MTRSSCVEERGTRPGRPALRASLVALVVMTVLTGCMALPEPTPSGPGAVATTSAPQAATPGITPPPTTTAVAALSDPARLVIPALGLDEPLIELGIAPDGGMDVPVDYDEVGWFTGGGRPGGTGPTVIAAHVDSPTGPAVFRYLVEVSIGDMIEVYDTDQVAHLYRVTETADYAKAAFPTARVFGATARDELRVITCGGAFDREAGSYLDNRVVYAERI